MTSVPDTAKLKRVGSELFARTVERGLSLPPLNRVILETSELGAAFEANGSLRQLDDAAVLEFAPPECPTPVPPVLEKVVGRNRKAAAFVGELHNCELVGPQATTIDEDGRYVLENAVRSKNLLCRSLASTARTGTVPWRTGKPDTEYDVAVSLVGPWCRGFFHWFTEWLPRLAGVERFVADTGTQPVLLIPPDPPTWLTDSLALVSVDARSCEEWTHRRVGVDRLVVPSVRYIEPFGCADFFTTAPDGYEWVGDRIENNVDTAAKAFAERVFVSRDDAAERRVVNESAVLNALEPYGFEPYTLSDLSLESQVRLFAGAEAVVAPHGAGLVNCLYGEDLAIVELFGDYVNSCYYRLARCLGHDYACLPSTPEGPDMRVDVADLLDLIEWAVD